MLVYQLIIEIIVTNIIIAYGYNHILLSHFSSVLIGAYIKTENLIDEK